MNTSAPVSPDAMPVRRLVITIALASIAAAAAIATALHHRPSQAEEASVQPMSSTIVGPDSARFVDVSLPVASEVFAGGAGTADEPCPTF